jgi:hypothetical protein
MESDINQCTQRYQSNVDTSKAEISTFNPLEYLFSLQCKNWYMCERQTKCTCTEECICDADDYVSVTSSKFELGSNCAFLCEFHLDKDISSIKNNSTILRMFTLENELETPQMDIVRHKHKVKFPTVSFQVMDDGVYIQNNVLSVRLNYMMWSLKSCQNSSK